MSPFAPNPLSSIPTLRSRIVPRGAATATSALLLGLLVGCGGGSAGTDPVATAQSVDAGAATTASDAASGVAGAAAAASASAKASIESAGATSALATSPVDTVVATGGGRTYVVGTPATPIAGAIRVATTMAVPWGSLPPGSVVFIAPGTYPGVTTITSAGTAANPITVTATDAAHPPTLTNSVDFQGASYVTVSHVVVQQPTYNGFIIRLGSNHVTVSDSTINLAPAGVAIMDGAGIGNQVLRNTINDSVIDGISLAVNSDSTVRSLVQYNKIARSGTHGIEVRASWYVIEYNTVTASGQSVGGASGIHVYRGSPSEDSGADNLVRYNLSYANSDKVAADGNGIEVDQWCDGNTVAFNQTWDNDGAGIIVYDGSSNVVQNNTSWSDGVNSGGTHVGTAEIMITGTSPATVKGNHVWNNLAFSTRASVPALYVDTRAVSGGNTIGANMLWNGAGGTMLRWTDSSTRQTAALIDSTTGATGTLVAAPAFTNAAAPTAGGLSLSAMPALHGVLPAGLPDLANVMPATGDAFFGAYYKAH